MADTVAVVAVVVVVASLAGAAPVVASVGSGPAAQATPVNDTAGNETGMAPGERMAGVVGAEQAAVESEVAVRAFGQRVAAANSSTAKARVVGMQADGLQARLDELDAERAELEQAHENGTLSTGQYRARLAKLYAEQRALQRLTNQTEQVARDLPEQALQDQGVNASAIRTLKSRARNLTGPEVADIARGVAGKNVGRPADAGPPDFANETRGPPGNGDSPGEGGPPGQSGEDGPPGQSGEEEAPGQSGEDDPPGQSNETDAPGRSDEQRGPDDAGPPGNETGPANNPNEGQAGNGTGSSGTGDDRSQQPTDTGPGDRGENRSGNETENGNQGGDDRGNGNQSGDDRGSGNQSGDDRGNGNQSGERDDETGSDGGADDEANVADYGI